MGFVGVSLKKSNGDIVALDDEKPDSPIQDDVISSPDDRLGQALTELRSPLNQT